jgi:hypothetical protein
MRVTAFLHVVPYRAAVYRLAPYAVAASAVAQYP